MLMVPVLRHWKTPTAGVSFFLTVATESRPVTVRSPGQVMPLTASASSID